MFSAVLKSSYLRQLEDLAHDVAAAIHFAHKHALARTSTQSAQEPVMVRVVSLTHAIDLAANDWQL